MNVKLERERYWQCPACGAEHERNENAAANLRAVVDEQLAPVASLRDTLRDGKALACGATTGETGPNDRRTAPPAVPATQTVNR